MDAFVQYNICKAKGNITGMPGHGEHNAFDTIYRKFHVIHIDKSNLSIRYTTLHVLLRDLVWCGVVWYAAVCFRALWCGAWCGVA